jgi:hypothetical protein
MRFFAVHDTEGNIARIVGCPDGAPPTLPASMAPGQAASEIVLPDSVSVSSDRDILADLVEVAEYYRLDVSPGPSVRIMRKDRATGE